MPPADFLDSVHDWFSDTFGTDPRGYSQPDGGSGDSSTPTPAGASTAPSDPSPPAAPSGEMGAELSFEIKVPVGKADLDYVDASGSVAYTVAYSPADAGDPDGAMKLKNGQPSCEAALKEKFGHDVTLKGGGEISDTKGTISAELEIETSESAKTTFGFEIVDVDAKTAEVKFADLKWKQDYTLAANTFDIEGLKVKYSGKVTVEVDFEPDWVKLGEYTAKQLGLELTTDAVMDVAISAELILVAIGTVAGTFNELAKAADESQLIGQITLARNMFTTGLQTALRGDPSPGGDWSNYGWTVGKKVFDDATAKAKSAHSTWEDDAIREKVIEKANGLESDPAVQANIKRRCGQQFWNAWIANNHGYGTFLGDAQRVCGMCLGKTLVAENDPDLDAWKKVSKLPDFFADR